MGNVAVSGTELARSAVLSVLAIATPILVLLVVMILFVLIFRRRRWRRKPY